ERGRRLPFGNGLFRTGLVGRNEPRRDRPFKERARHFFGDMPHELERAGFVRVLYGNNRMACPHGKLQSFLHGRFGHEMGALQDWRHVQVTAPPRHDDRWTVTFIHHIAPETPKTPTNSSSSKDGTREENVKATASSPQALSRLIFMSVIFLSGPIPII